MVSHAGAMLDFYRRWLALFEVDCQTFCNCQTFHYRFEEGRFVCVEIIDPDLSALESPGMPAQTRCPRRPLGAYEPSVPADAWAQATPGGVITRCANAQRGARPWSPGFPA